MLFSILIPAFKTQFLKECINSVLAQTERDFEIVVVDDASPNDIKGVLSSFTDTRIRYYKNEKGFGAINLVGNWNRCLEYSTGDYVICMGDDDMLEPECLEEYKIVIEANPQIDVFHARTKLIDPDGKVISILEARDEWESVWANMFYRFKGRYQFIGDYCFKATSLRERGGFYNIPLAWGADDITVLAAAERNGICNINKTTFMYRVNPYTISNSSNWKEKIESVCKKNQWQVNFIENNISNDDDPYYLLCRNILPNVFLQEKLECIVSDLSLGLNRVFFWFRNRNKYQLTEKMLIYSFVMAVVRKSKDGYKKSMKRKK